MKRRILFVDDDARLLQGLRRMLRDQKNEWDMTFVSSADEALARLDQTCYDAVVMDVRMPDRGGLDLLAELKAAARTQDTEVIMLTGLADASLKSQALNLGASDLLAKPIRKEDLIARLKSILRTKTYRDELRSQKVALEKQLLQSQKMELVGTLAAGAAYDLNNVLSLIIWHSEIVSVLLPQEPKVQQKLTQIQRAGERAGKIVGQILRLSKWTEGARELCSLSSVVDECLELLRPCLPPEITIECAAREADGLVDADVTQMCQVFLNLCMHTVQAMGQQGTLRVSLDEAEPEEEKGRTGPYLRLKVSDTDDGMDQGAPEHSLGAKETAEGTGLGLPAAHRIVADHGGWIAVKHRPEQGTSFSVYLPLVQNGPVQKDGER